MFWFEFFSYSGLEKLIQMPPTTKDLLDHKFCKKNIMKDSFIRDLFLHQIFIAYYYMLEIDQGTWDAALKQTNKMTNQPSPYPHRVNRFASEICD